MRDWLRLVRAPLAPTAAWDVIACTGLALTAAGWSVGSFDLTTWALLVCTSLLLYAFGMGLNDLADLERDRKLAPERPLPSGRLSPRAVFVALLGIALLALLLGGGRAGSREVVGAAILCAALYDLGLKRWLLPGALAMGSTRFANASIAVWPLVLFGAAPWTALLAPAAIGTYSAAVTIWSTTEEVDAPARRLAARGLAILAFLAAGGLPWWLAGRPTLGIVVASGAVTSLLFARTPRPGPPKRQVLEMLLGLYFLSMCIASGADGGSMAASLVALGVALALIYLSQVGIRWLRPRPGA